MLVLARREIAFRMDIQDRKRERREGACKYARVLYRVSYVAK